MYLGILVVAIGLWMYGISTPPPAIASHDVTAVDPNATNEPTGEGDGVTFSGHWDNWTVNDTDNQGLKGYLFIPAFLRLQCDPAAIHGPPAGFNKTDGVFGTTNLPGQQLKGGCTRMAWDALDGWAHGKFFDPRGGTAFIPPSGDHHRSGNRMLLQTNFSGGSWMSGFAPMARGFNHFNLVGVPGAGEAPDAVRLYCLSGINQFGDIPDAVNNTDYNGDGSTGAADGLAAACDDWASLAGAAITQFLDHHGEPMTPGRFPRYIPHERQGWPSTVVTKYTASSENQGHGISQFFHSSAEFLDGADGTIPVTWYSMHVNGVEGGCAGGWCEWFYDPVTHTLCMVQNASPGSKSLDTSCSGGSNEVTTVTAYSNIDGLKNGGKVLTTSVLRPFEKAPVVIYQALGEYIEMDTATARPRFADAATVALHGGNIGDFTHNAGRGDLELDGQAVWYEFWGLSGPNHQAEEGGDPYTFRICGSRGEEYADEECAAAFGSGGFDSTLRAVWAIVDPAGDNLGGLDPFQRYGADLRPTTGATCTFGSGDGDDPALCGDQSSFVACATGADAAALNALGIEISDCISDPGTDGVYGTSDDGTIYYREALENDQRGFVRENVGYAFSFLNGIGVNHPELCGTVNECGDSPSTGTRQVMYQSQLDLGATLSCFNCSNLGQHIIPVHGFDRYEFKWAPLPGVRLPPYHPVDSGSIPGDGIGLVGTAGAGF
jgi:hypothetical protein